MATRRASAPPHTASFAAAVSRTPRVAVAAVAIVAAVVSTAACAREPLPALCPDVAPGELVISELRGPQTGSDSYGQWIEIFNAADRDVDLTGLQVVISRLDGSGRERIIVRTPTVPVTAGAYAALGRFAAGFEPAHVAYGFKADFDRDLYAGAVIDLVACGERIDRVAYGFSRADELPRAGTLAVDGAAPPDADRNDDLAAWCEDSRDDPDTTTEFGVPGTPGEANPPCP